MDFVSPHKSISRHENDSNIIYFSRLLLFILTASIKKRTTRRWEGHAIWQSQEVSAGDEKYLGGSRGEQIHQSRSTQLSTQR
jgi:hypothetical protein